MPKIEIELEELLELKKKLETAHAKNWELIQKLEDLDEEKINERAMHNCEEWVRRFLEYSMKKIGGNIDADVYFSHAYLRNLIKKDFKFDEKEVEEMVNLSASVSKEFIRLFMEMKLYIKPKN